MFMQDVNVPTSIATETDRVVFVKAAVQVLLKQVRLKPKKLYRSDTQAVRELMKASILLILTIILSFYFFTSILINPFLMLHVC